MSDGPDERPTEWGGGTDRTSRPWIDFTTPDGRRLGFVAWFVWALAVSLGVALLRDDPILATVPLVTAAVLTALILRHNAVPGLKLGLAFATAGLLLVPAVDLAINPPCESIEYLQMDVSDAGVASVTCTRFTDVTLEVTSVFVGLALVGGLVVFLARRRSLGPTRRDGSDHAAG